MMAAQGPRIAALVLSLTLASGSALAAERAPTDLSGVWSNASITLLERPRGVQAAIVDRAEAERLVRGAAMTRVMQSDAGPSNVNEALKAGDPGGYNAFWMDPGEFLDAAKGGYRTSWIVDPADGRAPYTPAALARARDVARGRAGPSWDGPEALEPADRCLMATRGSGGPGMLNNIYNSNYQFVETPDHLVIVVEMIHDARIIPIFKSREAAQAGHRAARLAPWFGDSTAWREGRTLVVETVAVHPTQGGAGPIFLSPQARVTERFTRSGPDAIDYGFTVEDAVNYTRPWRAEMTLRAKPGQVYEYACHEGNYALVGILSGARAAEGR